MIEVFELVEFCGRAFVNVAVFSVDTMVSLEDPHLPQVDVATETVHMCESLVAVDLFDYSLPGQVQATKLTGIRRLLLLPRLSDYFVKLNLEDDRVESKNDQ